MPVGRHWRITLYIALVAIAVCVGDWIVFRIRYARSNAFRSITVEQYLLVSLKGNKVEYNYIGTTTVDCAQTLLPQYANAQWTAPCWWRERHRKIWLEANADRAVISAAYSPVPGARNLRRGLTEKATS